MKKKILYATVAFTLIALTVFFADIRLSTAMLLTFGTSMTI